MTAHARYVARLVAAGQCTRCRRPVGAFRRGKHHCSSCVIAESAAKASRNDGLRALGICNWCRDPMPEGRRGKARCRDCNRLDYAKRHKEAA